MQPYESWSENFNESVDILKSADWGSGSTFRLSAKSSTISLRNSEEKEKENLMKHTNGTYPGCQARSSICSFWNAWQHGPSIAAYGDIDAEIFSDLSLSSCLQYIYLSFLVFDKLCDQVMVMCCWYFSRVCLRPGSRYPSRGIVTRGIGLLKSSPSRTAFWLGFYSS